jgi:hypothetical protein
MITREEENTWTLPTDWSKFAERSKQIAGALAQRHQVVMEISEQSAINDLKLFCSSPLWSHGPEQRALMHRQLERAEG